MKHCQTLSSTIPNLTYFNIAKLIRPLDNFYFPHPNLKKKKKNTTVNKNPRNLSFHE